MSSLYNTMLEATGAAPKRTISSRQTPVYRRASSTYMPAAQKQSMLTDLARQAAGGVEVLTKVLDTPAAIFRGALAGEPASGFSWNDRVSGEDVLKKYGLLSEDSNPYLSTAAGLGAEVLLDPLFLVQGPMRALGIGGKAAKSVGLLDKAGDVAAAKLGVDAAAKQYRTARNAKQFLEDVLPQGKAVSPENMKYRPLVGPRVARTTTTLREVVDAADDPAKALQQVTDYLRARGVNYGTVADDTLGGTVGLGLGTPAMKFNIKAAEPVLDALDAAGQAARWSAPARQFSRVFDKRLEAAGTADAADQLMALKAYDRRAADVAAQTAKSAEYARLARNVKIPQAVKDQLGADSLLSPEASDLFTRFSEGTQTVSDDLIRRQIGPDFDQVFSLYRSLDDEVVREAKSLGVRLNRFRDPYGVLYSPRVAKEIDFGEYGSGMSRAAFATNALEQEARKKAYLTPGGTVDLREISKLPLVRQFVAEGEKSSLSIQDVGAEIKRYIDAKHGRGAPDPRIRPFKTYVKDAAGNPKPDEAIGQLKAEKIARLMQRLSTDLADNAPLFGEHALTSQIRTQIGQAAIRSNARFVYDSIAEAAIRKTDSAGRELYPSAIKGTKFTPLDISARRIANKVGLEASGKELGDAVARNIKERIAAANGLQADQIDLSKWALPDAVSERLTRINDFYAKPRSQEELLNFFNKYSTLFKGFVLAWPSRHTRDLYSNAYTVLLETGSAPDSLWGFSVARKIMKGDMAAAAQQLKELPEYARMGNFDAIEKKFVADAASTGILRGLASSDLLTSNRRAAIDQLVPGTTPMGFRESLKELVPDGSRNLSEMAQDFFTFKGIKNFGQKQVASETRNALLNASQKINDYTDSLARLAGYLALQKQGVTPNIAAERINAALVDYGSLTVVEKQLRNIFPWWAYNSRIGAYVVRSLVTNPGGGYAQTLRALSTLQRSDEETYIPEAMRQQFAFRVPDAAKQFLGIDEETDTTTFLKDIDIPGVDVLSLFDPGSGPYTGVQNTMYNISQQANPVLNTAVELATGTDTFSRRPLEQATTPADRVYRTLFGSKTNLNPLVRAAIELAPGTQRLMSLAGGLADDRLPLQQRIAKQAFNALTGVKLQDVDPEWQLQDARRALSRDLTGFTQNYTESYIPEDVLPQVPQELIPEYQLFRTLGRDLREARRR